MALEYLTNWAPFRIDALGLVTIIGAEEVNQSIGRLVDSPWIEFLPLLGAYVVAGNRFVQPIPGAVLYNVSDGIMATDVSGWLVRWLAKQDLRWNTTAYIWSLRQAPNSTLRKRVQAFVVGGSINGALLALSILVGDWFGCANALALAISVAVRGYMLSQNRHFLDCVADGLQDRETDIVKVFCTLADGRAVTLFAPRGFVTQGFLTTPRPRNRRMYELCKAIGWVVFGFHVICIGQATLFIQVLTVFVMVGATVVCIFGFGCDEYSVGRKMHVHLIRDLREGDDRRTVAYTRLCLTEEEEESMLAWNLFPQKSNKKWWYNYQKQKSEESLISGLLD